MNKIFESKKSIIIGLIIIILIGSSIWFQNYNKGLMTKDVITKPAGQLVEARSDHHAVLLSDGRIYIVGGDKTNQSAEIYDPKTKKSKLVASLPEPLHNQEYSVTVLKNGKILIAGGRHNIPGSKYANYSKTAYIYDPIKNLFEHPLSMNDHHSEHKAVLLQNGNVIITGGNHSSIIDLYNPKMNKFTSYGYYCSPPELKENKNLTLDRQGAILLKDDKILVAGGGGCDKTDNYSSQVKIVDLHSNKIYTTANMLNGRGYPTITLLKDGKVLVSGNYRYLKNLEIYDPSKGLFNSAGEMDERGGYTATLLPNGKVLFAGGSAGYGTSTHSLGSMYIYNPNMQSYTFLGNMKRKRAGQTATVLKDGSVVFIGGTGHRDIEIYKPTGKESVGCNFLHLNHS